MAKHIELKAQLRTFKGKAESRRNRRLSDVVPGIVYGANKEPQLITMEHKVLHKLLGQEAFHTQIIELQVDGSKEQVVLKDVQSYPGKPKILHVDFQRISAKEKLTMKIPLHFIGGEDAPGVKQEGGVISHSMSEVEIRCLPADLPTAIEVDVSQMTLNQVLHLSDLKLPPNIELTAFAHGVEEHDLPVASIHLPRVAREETPDEAEAAAEGEAEDKGEGDSEEVSNKKEESSE